MKRKKKPDQRGRKSWTPKQDKAILQLVAILGTKQWTLVAQKLASEYSIKSRSGKQCRQRFHNHLSPGISKDPWKPDQQLTLFKNYHLYRNKWSQYVLLLPGRTDNSIKNHFYSTLRKMYRQVHGAKVDNHHFRKEEEYLVSLILNQISPKPHVPFSQSKVNFFGESESPLGPPDLPEFLPLIDACILVKGVPIKVPEIRAPMELEEAPVEFGQSENPTTSDEVFIKSLM